MSEKEYKTKCVNLFQRNTVLINELETANNRITELEAQIEKMKCCGNCKHFDLNEPDYCNKGVYRASQYVCRKWEFGN